MIGERIKDFEVTAVLGKGGMGEVYVAVQPLVRTTVAIKLLREDVSQDRQHVQRFFQEAIAAGAIRHAGIVKIFDVGFHGDRAFLIMEHLEGESLAARLRRRGRLPVGEATEIAAQIASVLDATHGAGITHRDLKPDNVLLVPDEELARKERAKVIDFGIAKLGTDATSLTAVNTSMGTPAYMAPEQWTDASQAGAPADVYALGCVVFELCAGRPPFVVTTMAEACRKHLDEPPPRLRSIVADAPAALDDLVAAMLAKDPAARPTTRQVGAALAPLRGRERAADDTAGPLAETLPAAAVDAPTRARAAAAPARERRRRAIVAVAIGAAAVAAGAATIATWTDRDDRAPPGAPSAAPGAPPPGAPAPPTPTATAPPASGCPAGMVAISAGTFWMGSDAYDDERPAHEVTLAAFCLDRTEVTVAQYGACVQAGACAPAPTRVVVDGWPDDKIELWSRFCNGGRADRADHPINCIEWAQAQAYCGWAGKRLPTEAEWEYAARGSDGRRYPWGNDAPSPRHLNGCGTECRSLGDRLGQAWNVLYEEDDGWASTAPVGRFPAGASPAGALDLAGNVAEWTADWYGAYAAAPARDPTGPADGAARSVRDSGWGTFNPRFVRTTSRSWGAPSLRSDNVGVRCARSRP